MIGGFQLILKTHAGVFAAVLSLGAFSLHICHDAESAVFFPLENRWRWRGAFFFKFFRGDGETKQQLCNEEEVGRRWQEQQQERVV